MIDKKTHPAHMYLASLAPSSQVTMRQSLNVIASYLSEGKLDYESYPWWNMNYAQTQDARSYLANRYSPATARKAVSAMKGAIRMAWRLGRMTNEECARAIDVSPIRGEMLPPGRGLSRGELLALFNCCAADPTSAGPRDATILAMLYGGGLRREELAKLPASAIDMQRETVRILGKGRRERIIPLQSGTIAALKAWLCCRASAPGVRKNSPLILAVSRKGRVRCKGLTGQGIYKILERRGEAAGVEVFSPHDLRRSFISDLLDAGSDLAMAQKLAGHADVNTTARYDRRGEETKRRAVDLLHVPFSR